MKYIYNRVYDEDVFLYNEFIIFDDNNLPLSRKNKEFKQYTQALHIRSRFVVDRMYSIVRTYDDTEAITINEYLNKKLGSTLTNFELINQDGTALLIRITGNYNGNILQDGKLFLATVDYKSNDTIYPNKILERRLENISLLDEHTISYIKHFLMHSIEELVNKNYTKQTFKIDINHRVLNIVIDNILEKYLKQM